MAEKVRLQIKTGLDPEVWTDVGVGLGGINTSLFVTEGDFNTKVTISGNYTYIAKAPIGTAQATAGWQVKRIDVTSGVVILWANHSNSFSNVATNLETITYD